MKYIFTVGHPHFIRVDPTTFVPISDLVTLHIFSEYFGYYENPALFPPTYANLAVRTYWAKTICETSESVNQLCSLFQLMWTGMEWEGHLSPKLSTIIFTHFPNGMSTKLIVHMSQVILKTNKQSRS